MKQVGAKVRGVDGFLSKGKKARKSVDLEKKRILIM